MSHFDQGIILLNELETNESKIFHRIRDEKSFGEYRISAHSFADRNIERDKRSSHRMMDFTKKIKLAKEEFVKSIAENQNILESNYHAALCSKIIEALPFDHKIEMSFNKVQGDFNKFIEACQQIEPNHRQSLLLRGWIDDLTLLINLDPTNAEIIRKRAKYYMKISNYSAAIAGFTFLIRLDPKDIAVKYFRGWAAYQLQKDDLLECHLRVYDLSEQGSKTPKLDFEMEDYQKKYLRLQEQLKSDRASEYQRIVEEDEAYARRSAAEWEQEYYGLTDQFWEDH